MKYINENVIDEKLPSMAIVEEFVKPQRRQGDVDADYAIAGFVLNGKFFPTSANLLGTDHGRYIEIVSNKKENVTITTKISYCLSGILDV